MVALASSASHSEWSVCTPWVYAKRGRTTVLWARESKTPQVAGVVSSGEQVIVGGLCRIYGLHCVSWVRVIGLGEADAASR